MKNVFITGASRGIGESIAYYFAEKGFNVVGTARSEFNFKKDNFIGNLYPVQLDVTDRESMKSVHSFLKAKKLLCSSSNRMWQKNWIDWTPILTPRAPYLPRIQALDGAPNS